jgi:regulatory protein
VSQGEPVNLRNRALRLLARREHSRRELERKLAGEAGDPEVLASLLDEFERRGWLSEARVAEQRLARARGRYGPRRVLNDLKEKGLSAEALARAAGDLRQSELESATEVWRKRFGKPPADPKDRARQARFLAGRGFSTEVIRAVLGAEPDEP